MTQPWQTVPKVFQASTNLLSFAVPVEAHACFFRVIKLDTEPPQVTRLSPLDGAIAVPRSSTLQLVLEDETGINPASISFTTGTNSPVTLADSRLSFTNNVLTYTPSPGGALGNFGEKITASISVADTLGNTLANYPWTFNLERPLVPSDKIIFLGNPPASAAASRGLRLRSFNPAGTFVMSSPLTERERFDDETQHTVTLTHDFYMSNYEVTQREYLAVMGNNPSYFTTKDISGNPISPDLNRPVEEVSWYDASSLRGSLKGSKAMEGLMEERKREREL